MTARIEPYPDSRCYRVSLVFGPTAGADLSGTMTADEVERFRAWCAERGVDVVDQNQAAAGADEPVTEEWLRSELGGYDIPLFGDGAKGIAVKVLVSGREWILAFYPDPLTKTGIASWGIADTVDRVLPLPSFRRRDDFTWIVYRQHVLALIAALKGEPDPELVAARAEVEALRADNERLKVISQLAGEKLWIVAMHHTCGDFRTQLQAVAGRLRDAAMRQESGDASGGAT